MPDAIAMYAHCVPDHAPILEHDATCLGCGYQLRGLPLDADCPECSWPVTRTLEGDLLRNCPDDFLESLERGLDLVAIFALIELALSILALIAPLARGIQFICGVAVMLGAARGWWLATPPELDRTQERLSSRAWTRVFAVASAALITLLSLMVAVGAAPIHINLAQPAGVPPLAYAIGVALFAAYIGLFFASVSYLSVLARRVPYDTLANNLRWFRIAGPIVYVLGSIIVIGPIIARVWFLILLNRVRLSIVGVRFPAAASSTASEGPSES